MTKIISVKTRLATPDDAHLPAYDNTKLQAINTCPTWGILRYQMHKTFQGGGGRAMALEAGSAMHEVFAAVRLWQLWLQVGMEKTADGYPQNDLIRFHGERLFGKDKFSNMLEMIKEGEDERTNCLNFCLQALYDSGFYDDPSDRLRTMSNLEEAAILYIDKYDFHRMPIWIRDINDPCSDVGIEIPFDVVLEFELDDPTGYDSKRQYRFIGKFDGIHVRDGNVVIGENKTASRLDEAWRMSFTMSSQVTGYCLAGSVYTGEPVNRGVIFGTQIPLPKAYDLSGIIQEHVRRETFHFERWFDWFLHTVELAERYDNNPSAAPRYTHSCNRYFRPCAFIPFCDSDDEEQKLIISEMVDDEWSPLHGLEDKARD